MPPESNRRADQATAAAVLVALLAGLASLTLALGVLDGIPHVADGISYSLQGKIFAAGKLKLAPPPWPAAFGVENIILQPGLWCSMYPPGWPLMLSIGWLVGSTVWITPLLLAVAIVGAFRLGVLLFDHRTGLLAAALLGVSPFALFMSAGFMAHTPTLALLTWCAVFWARAHQTNSRRAGLASGLLAAAAFSTRPLTATAMLIPVVLIYGLSALSSTERRAKVSRLAGWAIVGSAGPLIGLLLIQHHTFGSAFTAGYSIYAPELRPFALPAGLGEAGELVSRRFLWFVGQLGGSVWGLPWGDLTLPLIGILAPLAPAWRRQDRRADLFLTVSAASLVVVYSFYYYRDVTHGGPRFAFEALVPMALLAARGLTLLYDQLVASPLPRLWRSVVATLGLAVLLVLPLSTRLPLLVDYHFSWYHGQSGELLRRIDAAGVGPRAVVLLGGDRAAFGSILLENALDPFAGDRIYLRDLPAVRPQLIAQADRPEVWLVRLELQPLPGVNPYTDRAVLTGFQSWRLDTAEPAATSGN